MAVRRRTVYFYRKREFKKTKKPIKGKKGKEDEEQVEEYQIIFKRFESWTGEKESSRAVLERFMKLAEPDEVWYYKHRAFEAKFKRISNKWFLLILPDWFFSFDGFRKSEFHANDLKWLKKKANTGIVFTDFRFIHYFLRSCLKTQKPTGKSEDFAYETHKLHEKENQKQKILIQK